MEIRGCSLGLLNMDRFELLCLMVAGIGILGMLLIGWGYENAVKVGEIGDEMVGVWVKVCGNLSGRYSGENWFGELRDGTGKIRVVAFGLSGIRPGPACIQGIVESYKGELEIIMKRYD